LLTAALLTFSPTGIGTVPQDPCSQGTKFGNCKACGNAQSLKGKKLNVLKNGDDADTDVQTLTIAEIRNQHTG